MSESDDARAIHGESTKNDERATYNEITSKSEQTAIGDCELSEELEEMPPGTPDDAEDLMRRINAVIDAADADRQTKVSVLAYCLYGAVQAAYGLDKQEAIEMCVMHIQAFAGR
jgi:hypothetical protein